MRWLTSSVRFKNAINAHFWTIFILYNAGIKIVTTVEFLNQLRCRSRRSSQSRIFVVLGRSDKAFGTSLRRTFQRFVAQSEHSRPRKVRRKDVPKALSDRPNRHLGGITYYYKERHASRMFVVLRSSSSQELSTVYLSEPVACLNVGITRRFQSEPTLFSHITYMSPSSKSS